MDSEYRSLKIPSVLADRIDEIKKHAGYRTVSEFVIDAARRRLEEVERDIRLGNAHV
jgi:metal-responsive CopG/Arc/MetJ family transcriptional regulator